MNFPTPPRRDSFEVVGRLVTPGDPVPPPPPEPKPDGDWSWSHRNDPGYVYPEDAYAPTIQLPVPRHRARTDIRIIGALVAATTALLIAGVLVTWNSYREQRANAERYTATLTASTIAATPGYWPGPFTAPTKAVRINPYTDSGRWNIGTGPGQLPPGRYTVTVTGELGGYWARCATADVCENHDTGLIANEYLNPGAEQSTLDIKSSDYSVRTAGVRLTPA